MEKNPTRIIKQIKIIGAPHPAEFSNTPISKDPDQAPTRFEADIIPKKRKINTFWSIIAFMQYQVKKRSLKVTIMMFSNENMAWPQK